MIKKLVLAACVLFVFSVANAAVIVNENGKVSTYASDAVVTIEGTENAKVDYNGINIFVPKGTKVVLVPSASNGVIITANNMKGVQVYGMTLNASGHASIVINRSRETIVVRSGKLQVTNQAGQVATISRGTVASANNISTLNKSTQAAAAVAPVAVDGFVANDFSNVNTQQATQNVEEEKEVLSPSAPR
jgi:uncharacterized cupin superfamily protein